MNDAENTLFGQYEFPRIGLKLVARKNKVLLFP
jgi:hypothetical protein